MAQAARLHLRLQKELKLLLTDPPPGASFPLLTSSSSLTTIDAQIKGPEGTVYAEGIFNLKIQIPERYPFQPPSVTFATPIYHPNIDNGGRICLDILNLPPKGAWQPSLNISTVLTSIGLLLSEPNPDDGLMCEPSREFKYNRQAFDQKARSMTQKYAHPAASGNACNSPFQSHANPSTVQLEVETTNHESEHEANEPVVSHKKLFGSSRKLSLQSSGQTQERDVYGEGSEVPKDNLFLSEYGNQMEVEGTEKVLKDALDQRNQSQEKLCGSRRKLSLEALSQFQKKSDNGMENVVPNHCPSLKSQNLHVSSSDSLVPQSGNFNKQGLHQSQDSKSTDDNINMRAKRLCQFGNKQPLGSLNTSKMINESNDEMLARPELLSSQSHSNALSEPLPMTPALDSVECEPHKEFIDAMGNGSVDTSRKKLCLAGKRLSLGLRGSSEKQEKGNKENVVPQVSEYYDKGSKNDGVSVNHRKCGTDGPAKLQEENSNNMLPHSHSVSSHPSKSFPKQQQNLSWDEKQQSDQGYNCDLTGVVKQKEAEESEIPESEAVIVLDSEDSEEERSAPSRSKPLLARKRLGKWRIRA